MGQAATTKSKLPVTERVQHRPADHFPGCGKGRPAQVRLSYFWDFSNSDFLLVSYSVLFPSWDQEHTKYTPPIFIYPDTSLFNTYLLSVLPGAHSVLST